MPLSFDQKKIVVAEVNKVASNALSAVIADNVGLEANEVAGLRAKARQANVSLRVVRNTLARRAVEGTQFECITDVLTGPTVLAFSEEDPGASARLIKDFIEDSEALEVKGVSIGGQLYSADKLKEVAALPTYDQALVLFMSVLNAPITKLVRTLAEPQAMLVRTLAQIAEAKKAEAA